jgi:putative DNA primase/helicase
MIELGRGKLSKSLAEFDNRDFRLNCKNGVIDFDKPKDELDLNKIRINHNPNMFMLKQTEVEYNPAVRSDAWEKFISGVFQGDDKLIAYVKKALGYCLLGSVKEQCAFFAYGLGANGKSTLFETVKDVLGDYAKTTEVEIILSDGRKGAREKEAIGKLHGTRYAVASEIGSDRWLNSAQFKLITGDDDLTGAKMYGDSFEFQPTFKLWFLSP